ncbi:uncharacterized protein LOC134817460 [Bolinopsis microptera]|uniref:uncharacterized protein LOC134817460 n=1 Tax=Bolinopsis microptera TaxID=2820187 RepID=UPI00307AB6AF
MLGILFQCSNSVKIKEFILKHFLIITEVIAVVLAFAWPLPGSKLSNSTVSLCIVAVIFFFTGLKLKTDELKSVYRAVDVVIICCVTSLVITTLIPGYIVHQLPFDKKDGSSNGTFTFGPDELKLGIILFNCAPATIATGIIMVTGAEGDVAVAVAVSTITNLAGCFLTPLLFSLFVDAEAMKADSTKLVMKLGLSLILPLFVGKVVSVVFARVREVVKVHKRKIGLVQSMGIVIILWIKLSTSIKKGTFELIALTDILILIGIIIACHLLLLLLNFLVSVSFCFKRIHLSVMLLLCSQKTLVLTAAIASALPDKIGDPALILLPCFIAHPLQMLIDSFLIQPLKKSLHFPLCVPGFCAKCRSSERDETDKTENNQTNYSSSRV